MHVEVHTYEAGRTSWATCFDTRAFVARLVRHRELVVQMIGRTIAGRYRGSFLGLGWTVLQPLLMLAVYTYVFGVVFKARWTPEGGSQMEFALTVFCGLIPFNLLSECAATAPGTIVGSANYVKRVVFPLELLPVVVVGSALVVAAVNTLVLLAAELCLVGVPPVSALLLPLAFVPCTLLALAISWFLAAFGVFVRDTASLVAFVTQVAFFVTPIVYPEQAVPERFRVLVHLNPMTALVDTWRGLALGVMPVPWLRATIVTVAAALLAVAARAVFVRSQRAFADVV